MPQSRTRVGMTLQVGVLKLLMKFGADVNHQNTKGWTALHRAALFGNMKIVRQLAGHKRRGSLCSLTHGPTSLQGVAQR